MDRVIRKALALAKSQKKPKFHWDRRVVPDIIARNIVGVSPMQGPYVPLLTMSVNLKFTGTR